MHPPVPRNAVLALLVAIALVPSSSAWAVNLVPNPSFETLASCPTSFGQTFLATPWDAPTTGTSDVLNACSSGPFAPDVPSNPVGFQNALTGVGYGGLIPYSAAPDYREYLQAPLNSPLVAAQTYEVRFYISIGDSAMTAIDRLGAYLSVGPVGPVPNYAPLSFVPQVETPANVPLNDAVNWVLVSGQFVAAGGEDHIVIGSFHDNVSTQLTAGPGTWPGGSYYYVDDVSVELVAQVDQACCIGQQCTLLTPNECNALGGTPLGVGTDCTSQPCTPTTSRRSSWGTVKSIYR